MVITHNLELIGRSIAKARKDRGLSVRELGKAVNEIRKANKRMPFLSANSIGAIELGAYQTINIETLQDIEQVLNVELPYEH